jgi:HAD superfamily hydrolase (TIGR01509 family)
MTPATLRAIIFDFNGVIADDESAHFLAFQRALAEDGLTLTKEEYYGPYLGMDERTCAAALVESATGKSDPVRVQRILERKAALFRVQMVAHKPQLFPGVAEFVLKASGLHRLAIASGGRREQIEFTLRDTPLAQSFSVLVSAEDVPIGKPDPAIYRITLEKINAAEPLPRPPIQPAQCLVIEDSVAGIRAGLAAGMRVLAMATTYPPNELTAAHLVMKNLENVSLSQLETLFK